MYVIVHKLCKLAHGKFAVGQGKNWENTVNLKMQFEWVPCSQDMHLNVIKQQKEILHKSWEGLTETIETYV